MSEPKPNVTLYTTEMCAYCQVAKDWLEQRKQSYREVRVDADDAAAAAMIQHSGQGNVPLTVVQHGSDETQVVGFNPTKLARALRLSQ